jgi:hypothetical protein
MFFEVLSQFSLFIVRIAFYYLVLIFGTFSITKAKLGSLFRRAKDGGVLASKYITFLCYYTTKKPLIAPKWRERGKMGVRIARYKNVWLAFNRKGLLRERNINRF